MFSKLDLTIDIEKEIEEFNGVLKRSWEQLLEEIQEDEEVQEVREAVDWLITVMEENVPYGKLNRAAIVLMLYRRLISEPKQEDEFNVCVIAWCAEILHTCNIISDDIMNNSNVRRGRQAWFLTPDVGMTAVNDTLLLENLVWRLLRKYCPQQGDYRKLRQEVQDANFHTLLGHTYETQHRIQSDCSKYNPEYYDSLLKHKTRIYSYYCPVAMGLALSGVMTDEIYEEIKVILYDIGRMFQIQHDYLNLYGDPETTGIIGTDIQDGKCTWLIVEALKRSTTEQEKILKESYGSKETENVEKVKQIYKDIKLRALFRKYESEMYENIQNKINDSQIYSIKASLMYLLDEIYQRDK